MTTPQIDFMSPEFQANPYLFYNQMRETAAAIPMPYAVSYMFTRYDDCQLILRDNTNFGRNLRDYMTEEEIAALPPVPDDVKPLRDVQGKWMLFKNPPEHTRLRGLVNKAFTPKMVRHLRERVEAIADELLIEAKARGEIELMSEFALRLPVTIIAEMLGVPSDDYQKFRAWSADTLGLNDFIPPTDEQRKKTIAAYSGLTSYFQDLIAQKRANPQDDMLSALIAVEEAGDTLTEEEIISTAILILIAGFETTTNLIGNGVRLLMLHREQWDMLVANPELAQSATEECLRYDSPITLTARNAFQEVEIGGVTVERLNQVGILIAAANHDPRHFTNPETFDITRDEGQALSFAAGIHFCLGAPLARMETEVAFKALVQHMPNLALVSDEFKWRKGVAVRGLEELRLTF